ncbi:LutC/YkgG family protein [Paenibacillus agricola]|uniref:LutC/YkgG family protein n=1 Tax=Paenibacillus agricola TaxID=2716264 RepID=UPI001FB7A1F7|nr:LUD domain-containing protein [Paenibacillus agricola]
MSINPGAIRGRDAFIANISSRLGRKALDASPPEHPYRGAPEFYKEIERSTEEKIQLFTDNWTALTGKVLIVEAGEAEEQIGAWLQQIAEELQVTKAARWQHEGLVALGLDAALAAAGVEVVPWSIEPDVQAEASSLAASVAAAAAGTDSPAASGAAASTGDDEVAPIEANHIDPSKLEATAAAGPVELPPVHANDMMPAPTNWSQRSKLLQRTERCELGIIWPDYAVANTSTLVLQCSPENGRSVSLLTDILFAVFRADQLVTRMGEAFKHVTDGKLEAGQYPSSLNLITGPSRSADIENDLTIGIHGPGKVYAVIIK